MAIQYRVYSNGGTGGAVDYGTVLADTASLTATFTLATSKDYTFAVRAYDTGSGLVCEDVSARVRVVTGPSGEDLTNRPGPVPALFARPGPAAGQVTLTWGPGRGSAARDATQYKVYAGTPTVSVSGSPAATVSASGVPSYSATLSGLTAGATYQFAVVASNASGPAAGYPVTSCKVPGSTTPASPHPGGAAVSAGLPPAPPVAP